jgi:membrane protease YdiL (CAAX protease family)
MIETQSISPLKKLWRLALYVGFGILLSLALSTVLMPFFFNTSLPNYLLLLHSGAEEWLPNASRMLAALQQLCTFLIPGYIFYYLHHQKNRNYPYSQKIFLYVLALNVLSIPLVEMAFYINQFFPTSWMMDNSDATERYLAQIISGDGIAIQFTNIIILCVLPAIGEELVFRFALQKHILSKTNLGPAGAIIITSLVFSFIHFDMAGFLPRFVLALILGTSYYFSRTLLVPILFHLFNNYMAYLQMKFGNQQAMLPEYFYGNSLLAIAIVIICAVLLVLLFKQMNKTYRRSTE